MMARRGSLQRAARGFTLLEVMVAISIFALLGVASYRVLDSVMKTDEALAARNEELRRANRAFWLMQQDFEQIVKRDVRNGSNSLEPNWLIVSPQEALPLQFTRTGRANPLGLQRSDMQRIAYAVDHHPDYEKEGAEHYHDDTQYLLRYVWPMLDGASGDKAEAVVQVLLPGIEHIDVSVQTNQGLMPEFPTSAADDTDAMTVSGLQVTLHHAQWGDLQRQYSVF